MPSRYASGESLPPGFRLVFYSTLFAVFSDRLFITVGGVNFYLFYLIVICNLAYLAATGWLWLSNKLFFFLAYLALSGICGVALGTGSTVGFAKAYLGILPCALYYPAFMRFINFDAKRCFAFYAELAFYVATFGIFYFPFQSLNPGRLASVFAEPMGFCLVCFPALFYYADEWQRERKHGWRCIILIIAVILTISSSGFLGLLFAAALLGLRFKATRLIVPGIVVALGLLLYNASEYFRLRLDDSVKSVLAVDVSGVNDSTFGLIANLFVTEQVFEHYPIFGGGLGSHVVSHGRFLGNISGAGFIERDELRGLGEWDASSLLLRIISELGLFGFCYAIWFIWYFFPRGGTSAEVGLALSIWCYIFLKFTRSGVYFNPEEFLFFSIYAVNGMMTAARRRQEDAGRPYFSGLQEAH